MTVDTTATKRYVDEALREIIESSLLGDTTDYLTDPAAFINIPSEGTIIFNRSTASTFILRTPAKIGKEYALKNMGLGTVTVNTPSVVDPALATITIDGNDNIELTQNDCIVLQYVAAGKWVIKSKFYGVVMNETLQALLIETQKMNEELANELKKMNLYLAEISGVEISDNDIQ